MIASDDLEFLDKATASIYRNPANSYKVTKSREHNKKTPKSLENSKKHCKFAK
jgi:hypothetical protein